jgi:hypothetical protein
VICDLFCELCGRACNARPPVRAATLAFTSIPPASQGRCPTLTFLNRRTAADPNISQQAHRCKPYHLLPVIQAVQLGRRR